jgi:hypothetical protein
MSNYVVIAQSPSVDVSQVVGPFRSSATALSAVDALESKGYNTEMVELSKLEDLDYSPPWDGAAE